MLVILKRLQVSKSFFLKSLKALNPKVWQEKKCGLETIVKESRVKHRLKYQQGFHY